MRLSEFREYVYEDDDTHGITFRVQLGREFSFFIYYGRKLVGLVYPTTDGRIAGSIQDAPDVPDRMFDTAQEAVNFLCRYHVGHWNSPVWNKAVESMMGLTVNSCLMMPERSSTCCQRTRA